jgi:hypothetical protein
VRNTTALTGLLSALPHAVKCAVYSSYLEIFVVLTCVAALHAWALWKGMVEVGQEAE